MKKTLKPFIANAVKEWLKNASESEKQKFVEDANAFALMCRRHPLVKR